MKRLFLILILLFPAVTLTVWVWHGMSARQKKPAMVAPNANTPPVTNLNSGVPGK